MKNIFLASCALLSAATFSLATLTSCDLDEATLNEWVNPNNITGLIDAANGCPNLDKQYANAVKSEGELITIEELKRGMEEHTVGFSMALLLNKSGINKLFQAASDFTKYSVDYGAVRVTLKLPTIQLEGCPENQLIAIMDDLQKDSAFYNSYYAQQIRENNSISCITMDLPIEVSTLGIGGGTYKVTVAMPIYDKIKGDDPNNAADYAKGLRTSIFADLKHAQLIEFVQLPKSVIGAINLIWQEFVSKEFRNYALFDIGAWSVGNGDIKLIAGAPQIKEKTVQFGVYSNVVFARNSETAIDYAFPDNADVGLNIHPDLIRGLLARMMREEDADGNKYISDKVRAEGQDSSGAKSDMDFAVTMTNIAKEYPEDQLLKYDWYKKDPDNWGKYFSLAFRFWSFDTICGYVDLVAGLHAEITDSKFSIGLGNIHAAKSSGALTLVGAGINTITNSSFFKGILDYTSVSFNFNELGVSTSKNNETQEGMRNAEMGALKFTIDGNGISLFLNFVDL